SEDFFALSDALEPSESESFAVPADLTNFRMSLGIRTLSLPARIRFTSVLPDGSTENSVDRTYPANYFEQGSATAGLGIIHAGGAIRVRVVEGSALFYASITDNRTNDSSR